VVPWVDIYGESEAIIIFVPEGKYLSTLQETRNSQRTDTNLGGYDG
jgi:hypothetical protein